MENSKENPAGQSQTQVQEFEREDQDNDQQDTSGRNPFLPVHAEVMVRRLPARLNSGEGRAFFDAVQKSLNANQTRFVFDFAQVGELDAGGIHLLLQCLEEVMKINGDVKLAAVPPGPSTTLERTGVDHLFEMFDNVADAVQSFRHLPLHESPIPVPLNASQVPITATAAVYGAD
jgi:anti-anti-sigma regulatory factor